MERTTGRWEQDKHMNVDVRVHELSLRRLFSHLFVFSIRENLFGQLELRLIIGQTMPGRPSSMCSPMFTKFEKDALAWAISLDSILKAMSL